MYQIVEISACTQQRLIEVKHLHYHGIFGILVHSAYKDGWKVVKVTAVQ